MEPDLKSHHITEFGFQTTLQLAKEQILSIRKVSAPDKDGDSILVARYPGHRAWVWVIESDNLDERKRGVFRLAFNFQQQRGTTGCVSNIGKLLQITASVKGSLSFDCRAFFAITKRLKPKPIICLPMKCTEMTGVPFDSIEGIHLAKAKGPGKRYDIFIDGLGNGGIYQNILFSYEAVIDELLADRILEEAVRISGLFVQKG